MRNELSAIALLLALSGCGGGSSSSTGGGTNGPVTAAPAPTPSPTPTPAPSVSYAVGFDLTSDREFETVGSQVQIIDRPAAGGGWVFDRASSSLMNAREYNRAEFRRSDNSMLFKVAANESTYPGTLLETSTADYVRWLDLQPETLRSLIVSGWGASEYVVLFREEDEHRFDDASGIRMRSTTERLVLGGSYTLVSDHPTSGSKSYLVGVSSTSVTRDGASGFAANATVQMNFSGDSFSATLPVAQLTSANGKAPVEATLQLSGTLDRATGRLEGTITTAQGTYSGHFAGAFFGPQAAEIGLGFVLTKSGGGIPVAGFIGTNRK